MAFIRPSIPKGTRDFPPDVMARREFIFETLRRAFRKFGYQPLETPSMELLSVLTGKYGEEGDRLIFRILNSGNYLEDLDKEGISPPLSGHESRITGLISEKALRYDLTVPFARYVVMNHNEINFPFKRYQIQPVWRADRPQRGRYREFYQCDADVVGSDSLLYESELIALYAEAFHALGLDAVRIDVNNRKILNGLAALAGKPDGVTSLCMAIDKLDKIGEDGVRKELEQRGFDADAVSRVFSILMKDGTHAEKFEFVREAFSGNDIGLKGLKEMEEVFALLPAFQLHGIGVSFNLSLARGLDYYTGTIFEVKPTAVKMGSLGGGGRYADLTGIFGLPGISGVGISFGADRIYDVMDEMNLFGRVDIASVQVMVAHFGEATLHHSVSALRQLRDAGISAEMYPDPAKLGKQFKYAERKNIPYVLLVGEEEAANGKAVLKDLRESTQEVSDIHSIIQKICR